MPSCFAIFAQNRLVITSWGVVEIHIFEILHE